MADNFESGRIKIEQRFNALYQKVSESQSYDVMEQWPLVDKATFAYAYLLPQIMQGGFIQVLHNGFAFLLVPITEFLYQSAKPSLASSTDQALQYFVQQHDAIMSPDTPELFAKLYPEHPFLTQLEQSFLSQQEEIENTLINAL